MRLTEQKLKELILEVMENDDDSIGMKHLSSAIKQLNNPDEAIRENIYESFISLWEMIFDDPEDPFTKSLGITSARRYMEFKDSADNLTLNFKGESERKSFEDFLEDHGFKQGREYDLTGRGQFTLTFRSGAIVYRMGDF